VYPSEIAIDPETLVAFAPVLNPTTPERAVAGGKYSSSTLVTRTTQVGDAQGSTVVVGNSGTHIRPFSAATGIFLELVELKEVCSSIVTFTHPLWHPVPQLFGSLDIDFIAL